MSAPPSRAGLAARLSDVLAIRGGMYLLRNHAVVDGRGRLVLRFQYTSNREAVRVFLALCACGALEDRE